MQHRIIDTHVHVWNFDKASYSWLVGNTTILNRNYEIGELDKEREGVGVTGGILVQAANNFQDTDWMIEVANENDWIKGVVGWLPLMHPNETAAALKKCKANHWFKGVRHLIHDEQDPKWLLHQAVLDSLELLAENNIPFDVVGVLPGHIETVLEVAGKIPSLKMVFDHLNQPPISTGERFGRWGDLMKEAAKHPGLYAKISGLGTTAGKKEWTAEDVKPYAAFAIEQFGEERCFVGGDWPVSLLAGSYSNTWKIYKEVIDGLLDDAGRSKVYFSNAEQFYRL